MRKPCVNCCIKHLAQAMILMEEARNGYPDHQYIAWGHLAEAASEIEGYDTPLASKIRDERKIYQGNPNYSIDIMELIHVALEHEDEVSDALESA